MGCFSCIGAVAASVLQGYPVETRETTENERDKKGRRKERVCCRRPGREEEPREMNSAVFLFSVAALSW